MDWIKDWWQLITLIGASPLFGWFWKKSGKPYIEKIDKAMNMILPNGGSSISDKINLMQVSQKRLENKLEYLRSDQRAFLYLVDNPIFKTDENGHCTYANKAYKNMVGLDMDEIKGTGWLRALHPDDRNDVFARWQQASETKSEFFYHYRFINQISKNIWSVECRSQWLLGDYGEICGAMGIIEITGGETPSGEVIWSITADKKIV